MDKALLIIVALIISAFIGIFWKGKRQLFAMLKLSFIAELPGKWLREGERKLNRENRNAQDLRFRGVVFSLMVAAVSWVVGFIFSLIFTSPFFIILLLAFLLPVGSSWQRVNAIKNHLQKGDLAAARQQLEGTVFVLAAVMEHAAIARAAIEYMAVQFSVKIISPIFWFLVLGVPGVLVSFSASLLQETLASSAGKENQFGHGTNYFYNIVNYIPARMAAFLWLLSLLFFAGNKWWEIGNRISPLVPMARPAHLALLVAANCLNLALGGPTSAYYHDGWVGEGSNEPSTADISRAQFIYIVAMLLMFVALGFFV